MIIPVPRPNGLKDSQLYTSHEYLLDKRVIFLYGEISAHRFDRFSSLDVMDTIMALDCINQEPIHLIINSDGGSIEEGALLFDTLKLVKSPIHTYGRRCMSMALPLLAAGDKRLMYPHGLSMLHMASATLSGFSNELKAQEEEVQRQQDMVSQLLKDCGAKKSKQAIVRDMERNIWLTAEETVAYGLADGIMTEMPF